MALCRSLLEVANSLHYPSPCGLRAEGHLAASYTDADTGANTVRAFDCGGVRNLGTPSLAGVETVAILFKSACMHVLSLTTLM